MAADEQRAKITLASIRRHSSAPQDWMFTVIGTLHEKLRGTVVLKSEEAILISNFISPESWYIFTNSRIIGSYMGIISEIALDSIRSYSLNNAKNDGRPGIDILSIHTEDDKEIQFEYENGKASIALIYGMRSFNINQRFRHQESDM